MQSHIINSYRGIGLEPFVSEASVVYIHIAEMHMCACPQIQIPCSDDFYTHGASEWADDVVGEGMPWLPAEKKALDHLIGLLARFCPNGDQDLVYISLTKEKDKVVPFAYPVLYQTPDGGRATGKGLYHPHTKKIHLLRHMLFKAPLELLTILYHEGQHAFHGASEILAHEKQIELCVKLIEWLGDGGDRNDDSIPQHLNQVTGLHSRLKIQLDSLK